MLIPKIKSRKILLLLFFLVTSIGVAHAQESQGKSSKIEKKKKSKKKAELIGQVGLVKFGIASFYANKFDGRQTATGETFDQSKFTCACNLAPLGTWIKVTNIDNGKEVVVKVNDRLHPDNKRLIDLSKIAARRLEFLSKGLAQVKVEVIGQVEGRGYF